MKRIVAILLTITIIMGMFSSCASNDKGEYVLKGEFFGSLIEFFNYYPVDSTVEEMNEAETYDIEAQTIVDWGLLPEDLAFENLEKAITKEIAILACLNTLYIKKAGNIDDIKDAKMCDYPQEMADAYANGLVILNDGYIDGNEKLTDADCNLLLENTMKAKTENTYEEGQGTVGYSDEVFEFSAEDLGDEDFIVERYEGTNEETEEIVPETVQFLETSITSTLEYQNDDITAKTVKKNENTYIYMSEKFYEQHFSGVEVGKYIAYTGVAHLTLPTGSSDFKNFNQNKLEPFMGKLVEVIKNQTPLNWKSTEPCVTLVIDENIDDVEKMANTEVEELTYTVKNLKFETLKKKHDNFKISVESTGTGAVCTVTKTFEISENVKGNRQDQEFSPTVTFTASIDNIQITMDNIKNFFKNDGEALFKVTCDTSETLELDSGGLRLTPDSNRNGKFWSNLTKSRFTDGMGAKSIKVAKAPYTIPNTGISGEIGLYLNIGIDGKITVTLSQEGNGIEVTKKENKVSVNRLGENSFFAEINVNFKAELQALIRVDFLFVKDVLSGEIAAGFKGAAIMSLYYEKDGNEELDMTGYGDPQEASYAQKDDPNIKYCVDVTVKMYVRGGLDSDNVIGKAAKKFGYDISQWSFEHVGSPLPEFYFHFEDGVFVDNCTRGDSAKSDEIDTNIEDRFTLSSQKVNLDMNMCTMIYIVDSPISDKQIEKNKGIKLDVKDDSIVEVSYNKDNKMIMLEAKNPGSTEVQVYVKKNKTTGRQYTQTFSVTVWGDVSELSTSVMYFEVPQIKMI